MTLARAWKTKTDREVIAGCLAGEASAWEALVARYQGFLFSVALDFGLTQTDAEDVFQNVCLKLCLHLRELRDPDRLMAWLGALARQECLRLRRRRGCESLDDAAELAADGTPVDALLRQERAHAVRRGLERLLEECRRLLALLYGSEPLPYAAVAARLGLPLGSIGPRRARCLERLRKNMEEQDR